MFGSLERTNLQIGLFTQEEYDLFSASVGGVKCDPHSRWTVPVCWIQTIFLRCYERRFVGKINELNCLQSELLKFRLTFIKLFKYDWVRDLIGSETGRPDLRAEVIIR